ncbi:hypothetical protein C2U70_30710 [Bradyrhizobium guangdongense]|nr:hypothetical protein C2U70_30710 [Bradyrhizobium guangdongense]
MPGLVPPARLKPLRRGEDPGIHVLGATVKVVDGRDKSGHDEPVDSNHIRGMLAGRTSRACAARRMPALAAPKP